MSDAPVPWTRRSLSSDPLDDVGPDRLMVFVPAIMSVGLVFSILTLVRDAFRWSGGRARERRTQIEAESVVVELLREPEPEPSRLGMLTRPSYLLAALVLVGGATYVAIGSVANFLRDEGYVRDIGWLLAISLALAATLGFLGAVSLAVFRSWPDPPPWTAGPIRVAPLTVTPGRTGSGPSWALTTAVLGSAVATGIVALMVGSGRSVAMEIDEPINEFLADQEWLDRLDLIDPFGSTAFSIGFVVLIGLSAFRCRVMAIVYPVAFALSWGSVALLRWLIDRPRPLAPTELDSFPSGHMVQAVFIAGLAPLAAGVLLSDKRATLVGRGILSVGVAATFVHRTYRGTHWPLDAVGGLLLGLVVVLVAHWVLEHRMWHQACSGCPWSGHPHHTPWRRGVFTLQPRAVTVLGWVGVGSAIGASAALFAGTVVVGIPTDPEGEGLGSAVSAPVQLSLAVLMAIAGLIALRWRAAAAFLMAVAAAGLGLFASIEYTPPVAFGLAAALLVPAAVTWLAWQPTETIGSIAVLASMTVVALTGTAFGSREIYGHYFGPTHPTSAAAALDSSAEWLWLGDVDSHSATIVAGGLEAGDVAVLRIGSGDNTAAQPQFEVVDSNGIARFDVDHLEPDRTYPYEVLVEEELAEEFTADAAFRTHEDGAHDLVVVLGSCTRSGSNGAVFDAMVGEQPDLYLALGDLHYANLESSDPSDHIHQYGRALSQPAQSALFSSVPTAYVWDDHDFGPNDADSSSPSRRAVSVAYRAAVPHHGVVANDDAPIAQAFTVGRVRFVLSDTRSQRTDSTMLGDGQLEWLIDELVRSARSHALVVWANPTPWISSGTSTSADDWGAYPEERQLIADALAASDVRNLVMVSGDAHMVAVDDGSNSGYSSTGDDGFPVLHAAALDRPGSVKGGPYSHGAFPGSGQYGRLALTDDGGDTVRVRLSGHTWTGEELVAHEVELPVGEDAM